jgi:hypothetical protein
MSTLATSLGDRAALSTIQPALTRDEPQLSDDPWWSYYTSQTRNLEGVVTALYESVRMDSR